MIDLHSHLLPGVDDGARTLSESMTLIRSLSQQYVTDIVLTPHYIAESAHCSPLAENQRIFTELAERVAAEGLPVRLYLGNEIYINDQIAELIQAGQIAPLAGSRYLLVELPMNGEYDHAEDIFWTLQQQGWQVVLAHPERYTAAQKDYSFLQRLYQLGALFQCDLGSIMGQYGTSAKRVLAKLAKDQLIFAFGTDIHRAHGDKYYKKAQEKLLRYYRAKELERVLDLNPKAVLEAA